MSIHVIEAAVAGVSFGVFCPSLARKLKGLFSKGVAEGATLASTAVQDVKKKL